MTSIAQQPTQAQHDEQWAVRTVLDDYRRMRRYRNAYDAAEEIRDCAARSVANTIVDDGPHLDLAAVQYRAARALLEAVRRRAAVGTRWDEKTRAQQFWSSTPIRKAATR